MKHIISLGAGVQSSTMALMAAHGEIGPMPDCAIFADTGAEPKEVYDWLDWLETQLPFPVYRVSGGSLVERELSLRLSKKSGKVYRRRAIPAFAKMPDGSRGGLLGRNCTVDHKIRPIISFERKYAGIKRGQKEVGVIQWLGISSDEMQRMKLARDPWVEHRWPLVELRISRGKCLEWMKDKGYPTPPRSACTFCPFHSDEEWRRIKAGPADEWNAVVQFERDLQRISLQDETLSCKPFLHPSMIPIDEVDFSSPTENQYSLLDECSGLCGT